MNDALNDKIVELYHATSDNVVALGYGHKYTDGEDTGELGVVFFVKQKLPLSEIPPDEVLPATVEAGGVTYKTDVQENDLQVDLVSNCYQYGDASSADFRGGYRPLKSGTSFSNYISGQSSAGTMGGLFLDTTDNTVVAVTCAHVMTTDYSLNINKPNNTAAYAADQSGQVAYQPGTLDGGLSLGESLGMVGFLKRYSVTRTDGSTNTTDIAVVGIRGNSAVTPLVDATSRTQYGSSGVPPIATSAEINSLLTAPKPVLEKSARSTGYTGGTSCPIYITGLGVMLNVSVPVQNTYLTALYNNILMFRYADLDANGKAYGNVLGPGDSGALLIANFNGTKKIVGVCFASGTSTNENSNSYGFACRIDYVLSEMKLAAWDGVSGSYSNAARRQLTTTSGRGYNKTTTINGKLYWQIGNAANASSTLDDKWVTFEPDAQVANSPTLKNTGKVQSGAASAAKLVFNGQTIYQKT